MTTPINFVFFGGEPLGVPVLEALKAVGLLPSLIVCNPDRPVGRKQVLTAPPVKDWARLHHIDVWQPVDYKGDYEEAARAQLTLKEWGLFVVVAYNFILPTWLLKIPKHQTINLHPSLLPKYRGASPIRSAILHDDREAIGVSVMLLDEKMDHGPVLAQEKFTVSASKWPVSGLWLDGELAKAGGDLLARTISAWVTGDITPKAQDHTLATYCGRLNKNDGELLLDPHYLPTGAAAYKIYLKIQAYAGWPDTFFIHNNTRIKITAAQWQNNQLIIEKIIPAGKSERTFVHWLQAQ